MIVRELVAVLGLEMDDQAFNKADQRFSGLIKVAQTLGTMFLTGVVARGMDTFVKMASDAEETANLMEVSFGKSTDAVKAWSVEAGDRMQRSRFTLQRLAAEFGGLTVALTGSQEKASEMSMGLSELAVDLTSLRNFTGGETEALRVLQSAMTGETESVKRFGVDLQETALKLEMQKLGLSGNFNELNKATKAQIRYNIITRDLAFAVGDAANTQDQYANASRALHDRLQELETVIGQKLLPGATRLVIWGRDALAAFLKLEHGTKILDTALNALGVVATVVAVKLLLPFIPAIAAAAALAAAIGGVIVGIEDFITFLEGGESVTGRILRKMGVDGDRLRNIFHKLGEFAGRVWDTIKRKMAPIADKLMPKMGGLVEWLGKKFNQFLDWVEPKLDALLEMDIEAKLKDVKTFFEEFKGRISEFIKSPMGKILLSILGAWAGKKLGEMAGNLVPGGLGGGMFGNTRGSAGHGIAETITGWFAGDNPGRLGGGGGNGGLVSSLMKWGGLAAGAYATYKTLSKPSVQKSNRSASMAQSNKIDMHFNVPAGSDPREIGKHASRELDETLKRRQREAFGAMMPSFGAGKL